MLRTRLMTAAAAVAMLTAPATFAQEAPAQEPMSPMPTQPAPAQPAPTTPADPAAAAAQATPAQPAQAAAAATPAAGDTVVDELRAQGQFSTLLTALDAAQLTETLRSQPAISIFAPTDAAFAALPEAERTRLLDPANVNELRQLLLYHVIVADVNSGQIKGTRGGVETAARTQIQLDGTGDAIKVDDATVTTADIDASNGAIFVIDKVLMPEASAVASGDADESEAMTPPAAPAEAPAAEPSAPPATSDAPPAPVPTPPTASDEPTAEPMPEPATPERSPMG